MSNTTEPISQDSKPKLWTGTFITLTCINFVSALTFYLLIVKIVEYTMVAYDATYSSAGLMVSSYVIAALFFRLVFGGKIDEWGIKKSILLGFSLNVIASCLYFVDLGFWFLFATRALHGLGFGMASGALGAGAALIVPAQRRGEGIGYFSMAQALATGIGPMVAIILTGSGDFFPLFLFTALTSAAALAGAFTLKLPTVPRDPHAVAKRSFSLSKMIQVEVLPLATVLFLVYIGYSGVVSFLTVFTAERSLTDAASLYFIVYAAVILVSRPPIGRRVDRKGENSVMYITLAALIAGFVALAFAYNAPMLLLSAALIGFGIGATQSTIQATIVRMTPPEQLGRANSTFFASMDLGSGIGPVVLGALIPIIGYVPLYLGLAILAALTVVLYHAVHGRKM